MSNFLGRGYDFPLRIGGDGKFKMVSGNDKIKASIRAILSTPVGTRIMNREFGCRIHELNFDNDQDITAVLADYYTREALVRWEPRIIIPDEEEGIVVWFEGPKMFISITYTIIETNTEDNIVYPFHMKEAN